MGGFSRFMENVKQAFGCGIAGEKDWVPTSNKRNQAMLKECKTFAMGLRSLHADLLAWGNSVDGGMVTIKAVLEMQLPQAHDEGLMGCEPLGTEILVVGQNVRTDILPTSVEEMKEQLATTVLEPITKWLSGYRITKERNKKCMKIRLDVDSQARDATAHTERYNRQVAKDPESDSMESLKFKMQTAEDKRQRLQERYTEMEKEIFHALLIQITDSAALREHVAGAIFILQNTFGAAYAAFNLQQPVKSPMMPPGFVDSNRLVTSALIENSTRLRQSMAVGSKTMSSLGGAAAASHGGAIGGVGSVSTGGAAFGATGGGEGDNPFAPSKSLPVSVPGADDGANPFAPGKSSSPDVKKAMNKTMSSTAPAPMQPAGPKATPGGGMPAPPAWYTEARDKARVIDDGEDSDEDGANPFAPSAAAPSAAKYASNPSSRPGTWRGQRPSAGAFKA